MKKTLALVLAIAMVFSTITVVFAEDTLGEDAQICADLGMLKGETGTVDAAYVATAPTRLQAAIMFLRLRGLEAEALAFTGEANFADGNIAWAEGANLLAYLKANPQLGWQGDGTNFNPNNPVTAKEYYKVLLEALGYKQSTPEVIGDFGWDNVLEFAAEKGLKKVAEVESYTVNDLAVATVEALKLNVKEGDKTLVATLVEAGKIDAAKAESAGIYTAAETSSDAKLKEVKAVANDKVEVTFDAEVEKAFAENAENYKIFVKGSKTELEVKEAVAVGTDMAALTTAAQTGGTAYTIAVGEVSKNFAGVAKSSGVLELDTVKCYDTNTVEVVFKKAVDRASAENIENYTLNNGATVKKAEVWVDLDETRKTVKLTTEGVANNKIYKLKIADVKSADMVSIRPVEKSFSGVTDTKAPTISGNVVVKNNQRIQINFSDAHGIDKASAEDMANITIEGLEITKITAKDAVSDKYDLYDQIEIDTEPMASSKKYTVTINNLADGSTSKNVISKTLTKSFTAMAPDKTGPKATTIEPISDNMVEVTFSETNRLDAGTATDVNNYTFNEGLTVLDAKLLRPTKPDHVLGKTVLLTTSTMDKDTTYKITVENVADEFGNVMSKVSNRSLKRSLGPDIAPPVVTKVVWGDLDTVKLTFNERLDADSAEDPANYVINKDLGAVVKAELDAGGGFYTVELTTAKQAENTKYTVTINGVKDRSGNSTVDYKAYFTSGMEGADTTRPEIESISAINNKTLKITFNEKVQITPGGTAEIDIDLATDADGDGDSTNDSDLLGDIVGAVLDDETTVTVITRSAMANNNEYGIVKISGVKDKFNNSYVADLSSQDTFYANTTAPDTVKVETKDQVDARTIRFTFSEPVTFAAGSLAKTTISSISPSKVFDAEIDIDGDKTNEALATITLKCQAGSANIAYDKDYEFDLSASIFDYMGAAVEDDNTNTAGNNTVLTTSIQDEDKPYIDYVESVNKEKIRVIFSEAMGAAGQFRIKTADGKTTKATVQGVVDGDDDNVINLAIPAALLTGGEVYLLQPYTTGSKDIAGNSLDIKDVEFEFVASDMAATNYIKGVQVVDSKQVKVTLTKKVTHGTDATITLYDKANASVDLANSVTASSTPSDTYTVALKKAMLDGATYVVKITGAIADTFEIAGIASEGGIEISDPDEVDGVGVVIGTGIITFSGMNAGDATTHVVKVVYDGTPTVVKPASATADYVFSSADFTAASITTGKKYTIEVYRVLTPATAWGASYDAVADDAVLYSKEFTKK